MYRYCGCFIDYLCNFDFGGLTPWLYCNLDICGLIWTEAEVVRDPSGGAYGGPSADQGTDHQHPDHRVYPRKVGHHHSQGRRTHLHPTRQAHDICECSQLVMGLRRRGVLVTAHNIQWIIDGILMVLYHFWMLILGFIGGGGVLLLVALISV